MVKNSAVQLSVLIWVLLVGAAPVSAQGTDSAVRIWEAALVIPTYELGPPDLNPALLGSKGSRPVYPYPMLDDLTERRVQKTYKAVYLENEYLRVTVLPELGGRLYAIYDRSAKRDALYTNHVVKYGMVALRGAWISGGIEWNFPDGHTVTTVSPIDYSTRRESDGAAAVVVGDTERIQGMQWAVVIRLRPGRKVVETEVTLNNRRDLPGRYWYWATAAAPATADQRFVYPMREAYPHAFWPVFSFPKHNGVDLARYAEVPNALSLFARNSRRDFFGVYYEKSDWGIVHVADHRELAGKKTWTWGDDPSGRIWIDKLTEKDGQYVEFQAGRFETQMEHEIIPPHRVEHFTEYWYPVQLLGGPFDEANAFAALRISVNNHRARISIDTTLRIAGANVTLEQNGRTIYAEQVTLIPDRPITRTLDLPQLEEGPPVAVKVTSTEGWEVIAYRSDLPLDGNPDFKPAERPAASSEAATAETAYLRGLALDKKSDDQKAREAYFESLKYDAGFSAAHTALGLSFLRSGEYEKAEEHLAAALRRDSGSSDAHYYLGLAKKARGMLREAEDQMAWMARSGAHESLARYEMAMIALKMGNPQEAIEQLSLSLQLDPRDVKARATLALADRLAGRLEEARSQIDLALQGMPLDYFALSELNQIAAASGLSDVAGRAEKELWRLLSREPDSVLELAFDYAEAGRIDDCGRILQTALQRASAAHVPPYPMIHYALGYFTEIKGDSKAAVQQYALGSQGNPSLVFPHRLEELEILRSSVKANPTDGRAWHYLGNVLAARHRDSEALQAWRRAVQLDKSNPVAERNLALALVQVENNKTEAVAAYERAIALSPGDPHLYAELDGLLKKLGQTDSRIRLLEGAPSAVKSRSTIVQALSAAYLDAGRYGDALALLGRSVITQGEGETAALAVYRRASLGLAGVYRREGKHVEAAAQFINATLYPSNLGVGRSSIESHAREYVSAARELEAAGQTEAALNLWRRAADEPLGAPTLPYEPWSLHYYYKAEALQRVGRAEEAGKLLSRLAALADDHLALDSPPEASLRLVLAGLALKALGRNNEARVAFERALKTDPANELVKASLQELAGSPGKN